VAEALVGRGQLHERVGDLVALKYIVDGRAEEIRRSIDVPRDVVITDDLRAPMRDPQVNVVVELFGGTTAARSVIEDALNAGKDVVTANKALLAQHGDELLRLARRLGRCIAFEASVGGGIPVIGAIRNGLVPDRIQSIYGVVNGTCNYILTQMLERQVSYAAALAEAQQRGYAEADPRLDVEGLDSAHKLAVLARLAFGVNVRLQDIPCEGITGIDLVDLKYARQMGYVVKLLAVGLRDGKRLELRVHPALVRRDHPIGAVGGVFNAVCINGDRVGQIVLAGQGAGRLPTSSAVVADIVRVALGTYCTEFAAMSQFDEVPEAELVAPGEIRTRYYFRLECADRPGVLARVAGVLGDEAVSIASVRQQELPAPGERTVPVVFMTHRAPFAAVSRALERINRLDVIRGESTRMLRVEDL